MAKFNEAYKIAMEKSEQFREHDRAVKEAQRNGEQSACLVFGINGEAFFYGFDGVDIQTGKHSPKTARRLFDRGDIFVI